VKPNRIVLRCPEVTLKGRNRGLFERVLLQNVVHRLGGLGLRWRVRSAHGRVYVDVGAESGENLEAVLQALAEVTGAESVAAAIWLKSGVTRQHTDNPDMKLIEDTMVGLARRNLVEGGTFAVRVNRVDKRLPLNSIDMERRLGQIVRDQTSWDRVDLENPDRQFALDVYADGMYFTVGKIPGVAGLPVGTGGRVLALLSGGIDSPVAAFELAKRGCRVDFFHLSATYSQQRDDATPVVRLAESLSRYTLRSRLFTAPATHLDLALTGPPTGLEAILFRRFLVRVGTTLARRLGARALVTGDSLGQVASQTLENLTSVYQATEMPIFNPLIGANKQQTIDTARRIGTYEISIEPSKDCCALLAQHPRTHSEPEELLALEQELLPHYDRLIDATLSDLAWRAFECGAEASEWQSSDENPARADGTPDTSAFPGSRVGAAAGDGESGSGER
jgi:thiamine biosynthesis protein ThiI